MMRFDVEYQAPDISAYRKGNIGPDYVHQFTSGKAGPNILITGLIHGNEISGAVALDFLLKKGIRPEIGTLTLCFANVAAYRCFNPAKPHLSRYLDVDMNRVWSRETLKNGPASRELARAREILPVVEQADYLLDIHSMSDDCQPLALAGKQEKGVTLARAIGLAPYIIMDRGHASGLRLRDCDRFSRGSNRPASLLMECGQHWRQATAEFAINSSLRFLVATGILGQEKAARWLTLPRARKERVLDVTHTVTVEHEAFFFTRSVQAMERIKRAGTELGLDGVTPVVTPYDDCFLVMPQPGAPRGNTAVRMARSV